MPKKKPVVRLPKEFKRYFWDVEYRGLSVKKHLGFVLSRILSLGDLTAIKWILKNVDKKAIKEFVISKGEQQLDRRSNNFWRIFFKLPPSTSPVNPLWPY